LKGAKLRCVEAVKFALIMKKWENMSEKCTAHGFVSSINDDKF
jgi:hypothetical protein